MATESNNGNTNSNNNDTDVVSNNGGMQQESQQPNRRKSLKRSLDRNAEDSYPAPKYLKVAFKAPVLKVKKLSENAKLPVKGSEFSAGYDLHAAQEGEVPANGKALIKTDIAIAIPVDCYGRIAPRSGLSWKHHIDIGAGVIDSDYRGNVGVVMFNHSNEAFKVSKHMRIAQLILERYEHRAVLVECDDLEDTMRGQGGFGSTGMAAFGASGETTEQKSSENSNDNSAAVADANNGEKETNSAAAGIEKIVIENTSEKPQSEKASNEKAKDNVIETEQKEVENENSGDSTNASVAV